MFNLKSISLKFKMMIVLMKNKNLCYQNNSKVAFDLSYLLLRKDFLLNYRRHLLKTFHLIILLYPTPNFSNNCIITSVSPEDLID